MNTRTSAFRRLAILSLSALAFAACESKTAITPPVRNTQVTITPSVVTNLPVGQSVTFVASVSDDTTGALSGVTYLSTNPAVATVSAAGVVTAVAPGTTTVIATSKFNTGKSAAAQVTVVAAQGTSVVVSMIPTSATTNAGTTIQLVTSVTGSTNTAVTYTTSDATVATVSATGLVTATQKNGTAVITATSAADATKSAASVITVINGQITGVAVITISPTAASVPALGTVTFNSNVSGVTNTAKTFSSSDTTVATINATTGVATAKNKAGSTTITATSSADPTKTATATLTVTKDPIVVTASPNPVNIAPQGTQQLTIALSGGSATDQAQGVTCVSASPAIATVTTPGCLITGVASGSTTVTVTSVADPSKIQQVQVNIANVIAPSLSISSVTTPAGVPIAPGGTVTGNMIVTLNLTTGTNSSIQRVAVRLNGVEACAQTFPTPLAPSNAPAQITCPVNTAQLNSTTGAPIFPNGTYTLTADAFSTTNSVAPVATANYGLINLANASTINGSVTYDNSLADTDNIPDLPQDIDAAGNSWNGGSATVTVTTAIFSGAAAVSVDVTQDVACNGVVDPGVDGTKTATLTNGTGSVTFSEAANVLAATSGNDDVQSAAVCYIVGNARAADNSLVTLPAGNGRGAVSTVGTGAPTVSGRVDNVEPAAFTLVQPGAGANNYIPANTSFTTAANVTGGAASITDGGVGRVTVDYFAIPTSTLAAGSTQAQMRTAVNAQAAPTTNSNQLTSSITNLQYTLVARATDALGNTRYVQSGAFGVDLQSPTLTRTAQPTDSINPLPGDLFTYTVTDTLSGFGNLSAFVYRVNDANPTGVCVDANAPATPAVCDPIATSASGTLSVSVATVDALVPDGYYFVRATGTDVAGNAVTTTSSTGDSKIILLDTAVPAQAGVVVPITAQTGGQNSTISASATDNVDLRAAVPQMTFGGAGTIPVFANTDISTFGVPLVTSTAVSATFPFIRSLNGVAATAAGFNIEDVAFNASGSTLIALQAGVVDVTTNGGAVQNPGFGTFALTSSAADIDRTPGGTAPNINTSSATLSATVTGNSGTLNYNVPFNRVMFTFTDRAGIERVLTTTSAPSAGVAANNVDRTYTYTAVLSATALKDILATTGGAPGGTTTVRAIGIDADGDAVSTNTVAINVRN